MSEQYQGQPAAGFKPLAEWGQVEPLSNEELEAWKRSPITPLESRIIATITDLERQLAEAQGRGLLLWEHAGGIRREGQERLEAVAQAGADEAATYWEQRDEALNERDEAQGKLEAIEELVRRGQYVWTSALDRILSTGGKGD